MIEESRLARLVALLDGELSGAQSAAVEAELSVDLALAEERDALQALDRSLRGALASLGSTDDSIASAVLARAPDLRRADTLATARPWLAVIGLAAALLLVFRLFPPAPPAKAASWRLARGESAVWVPSGVPKKISVEPATELRGAGELFTLDRGPAALEDPSGAEVLIAPRSAITIEPEGAAFQGGRLWVRGDAPLPVRVAGARVVGRGSFAIEERNGLVVVSALAGKVVVLFPAEPELALAPGMALHFGGKAGPEPVPAERAILGLAWAREILPGPPLPGSALEELVRGHIALLADGEASGPALKGFATLGGAAVPALRAALLDKTAAARPLLAKALREAVGGGPLADALAEPLFDLPLAVERALLGDVIDSLAAATGVEAPERDAWFGKIGPEERAKLLEAWREKWRESRRRF